MNDKLSVNQTQIFNTNNWIWFLYSKGNSRKLTVRITVIDWQENKNDKKRFVSCIKESDVSKCENVTRQKMYSFWLRTGAHADRFWFWGRSIHRSICRRVFWQAFFKLLSELTKKTDVWCVWLVFLVDNILKRFDFLITF